MSRIEKIFSMMSVACFGFFLACLCFAIDQRWDFTSFLAVFFMLVWHGAWGGIGIYDFMRRDKT